MRNKNDFIAELEAIEAETRITRKKYSKLIKSYEFMLWKEAQGAPIMSEDAIWANTVAISFAELDAAREKLIRVLVDKHLDIKILGKSARKKG